MYPYLIPAPCPATKERRFLKSDWKILNHIRNIRTYITVRVYILLWLKCLMWLINSDLKNTATLGRVLYRLIVNPELQVIR
jgi:hypothetical protein